MATVTIFKNEQDKLYFTYQRLDGSTSKPIGVPKKMKIGQSTLVLADFSHSKEALTDYVSCIADHYLDLSQHGSQYQNVATADALPFSL